jgi:hypothetical protein
LPLGPKFTQTNVILLLNKDASGVYRFADPTCSNAVRKGVKVKLLLIGGLVGLIIGVGVFYFSMAKFFAANARALDRNQKAVEQMARETQMAQPLETRERLEGFGGFAEGRIKTAAKAGK